MNTNRVKYAELVIGSHLYGGATDDSDRDYLDLYVPTLQEMVENRRVVIPSEITDTVDRRSMLLGDFVMSLGDNPENTLIALSYPDLFPPAHWFVRQSTAQRMHESGRSMFGAYEKMDPKSRGKQMGHAYRYLLGGMQLWLGHDTQYPLDGTALENYLRLRADDFDFEFEGYPISIEDWGWDPFPRDSPRDLYKMAEWVYAVYRDNF